MPPGERKEGSYLGLISLLTQLSGKYDNDISGWDITCKIPVVDCPWLFNNLGHRLMNFFLRGQIVNIYASGPHGLCCNYSVLLCSGKTAIDNI